MKLGKILGFPIRIDYSWLAIVLLLTASLASNFGRSFPDLGAASRLSLGLSASLLLFGSVLAHELSHAVVARRHGVGIRGITLFIFGGAAEMVEEPKSARAELLIAIAGPLMSLFLAVGFGVAHQAGEEMLPPLVELAELLSRMNFMLVAFNVVPGFPLDGGRVLRALLWGIWGKLSPATRVAAGVGTFFGMFVILLGFFWIFLLDNLVGGLWFIFIGFFLRNAARASFHQLELRSALDGVTARELMTSSVPTVRASSSLQDVVQEVILPSGESEIPVLEDGRLVGMLRLESIQARERGSWAFVTAHDIMSDAVLDQLVHPEDEALKVLALLGDEDRALPVVEDGRFLGLVSRDEVLRRLKMRLSLGPGPRLAGHGDEAAGNRHKESHQNESQEEFERQQHELHRATERGAEKLQGNRDESDESAQHGDPDGDDDGERDPSEKQ